MVESERREVVKEDGRKVGREREKEGRGRERERGEGGGRRAKKGS